MAYSILLQDKKGNSNEIPFSTYEKFHEFWLPKIQELRLKYLSCFPTLGCDLSKNEFELLKLEVKKLKESIEKIDADTFYTERLYYVTTELEKINYGDYEFIHIGG